MTLVLSTQSTTECSSSDPSLRQYDSFPSSTPQGSTSNATTTETSGKDDHSNTNTNDSSDDTENSTNVNTNDSNKTSSNASSNESDYSTSNTGAARINTNSPESATASSEREPSNLGSERQRRSETEDDEKQEEEPRRNRNLRIRHYLDSSLRVHANRGRRRQKHRSRRKYQNTKFLKDVEMRNPSRSARGAILAPYKQRIERKVTVDIWAKYRIIIKIQEWNGSMSNFHRKYYRHTNGALKWIRKLRLNTLRLWKRTYYVGSEDWERICKFIEERPTKISQTTWRFKNNPFRTTYGFFPVLEAYIVYYRTLKAKANQYRTIKWMLNAANYALKNPIIRSILWEKMDNLERRAHLENDFEVSRSWIVRVMVCTSLYMILIFGFFCCMLHIYRKDIDSK